MLLRHTLNQIISSAHLNGNPQSNKDYEIIKADIQDTLGESLGVNTLKRMFGQVNDGVKPTKTSLNIIARYLNYSDWDTYEDAILNGGDCLFSPNNDNSDSHSYICSDYLKVGTVIDIKYEPEQHTTFFYEGKNQFKTIFTTSKQLKENDILDIREFHVGSMLVAHNIIRDSKPLNQGIKLARLSGGISYLRIK